MVEMPWVRLGISAGPFGQVPELIDKAGELYMSWVSTNKTSVFSRTNEQ